MSYFLRKKWMVNLSGAGKILWALNMKKDSYPYLICMTVLGLIFIFLFFWWRADIYRVTFLNQSISHYYILFSMGIAFLLSLFWVKKGIVKQSGWKSLSAYLKVYAGMCIFAGFFLIIPLTTLTYFCLERHRLMLHRIGILPVVQKVVLELRWMTPIYMRIFAFAIRMAIMSTIILSMLKRKLIH